MGRGGSPRRAPRRRRRGPDPNWRSLDLARRARRQPRGDRVTEPEQAPCRSIRGQRVYGVAVQPQPSGAREVLLDEVTPNGHGQVVAILAVPRHLLDREAILAPRENRSTEQELQWDAAVVQRVYVFGRGNLEVIRALQGQIHLSGAGESLHHGGGVLPQERVLRGGPAFAWAEQVQQACGFGVGVTAAHRVDA